MIIRHEQMRSWACALCLACFGMAFAASAAFAQSWGEIRVAERLVNVRQSRTPSSALVRSLRPGEKVKVDFVREGWGALFDVNEPERDEARAMGYADVRLLTPFDQSAKAAKALGTPAPQASDMAQIRYVETRTEIRRERSLKAEVVAVLAAGEHVQVGFARDGFLAVFKMNDPATDESSAIGYIPQGMVRAKDRGAAAAKPAAPAAAPVKPVPAMAQQGKSTPSPELKSEVREQPSLLGKKPATSSDEPVRITSDKMTYSQSGNAVTFLGNVHATQGEMQLWANKITAYFTKKDAAAQKPAADKAPDDKGAFSDKIERIVAESNVRMASGKNDGACEQLTFFVQENLLRMDGNPVLREGQNTVRGDVIKFYVKENRSEVLSGKEKRVEAIFFSPKSEKK